MRSKYQLAFGDAPLKMEENETVTTPPLSKINWNLLESQVTISTPAGTGTMSLL
jgi:hypothetical protein